VDVVERSTEFDGDTRGVDTDVEIAFSVSACPRPQVAIELLVQLAEERVREDVGKHEPPVGDAVEKRDSDLVVDRLLGFMQFDLLGLITERSREPAE